MSAVLGWNRGLLVGMGRLGAVGLTFVVEGVGRLSFMAALASAGAGVAGASAGLALGIAGTALFTELLIPRPGEGRPSPIAPGVAVATFGLFFIGLAQFTDVIAVRVGAPHGAGAYAAAATVARLAFYAQGPAAAFALRRSAVAGPRRALGLSL